MTSFASRDLLTHMKALIDCPVCKGRGKTELHEHLQETLDALPKNGATIAQKIRDAKFPWATVNAISGRLADLLDLKLVTRQRHGKYWRYSRA